VQAQVFPAPQQPSPITRLRPQSTVNRLLDALEEESVRNRFRDPWAMRIKGLVEQGPDAVTDLISELDATDNDMMLRTLGFVLRAIGDKRAVPALIRALPRTLRKPGSNMGLRAEDKELLGLDLGDGLRHLLRGGAALGGCSGDVGGGPIEVGSHVAPEIVVAKIKRLRRSAFGNVAKAAPQPQHGTDEPIAHSQHIHEHDGQEHERSGQGGPVAMIQINRQVDESLGWAFIRIPANQHQRDRQQAKHPIQHDAEQKRRLDLAIDEEDAPAAVVHGFLAWTRNGCCQYLRQNSSLSGKHRPATCRKVHTLRFDIADERECSGRS
jgi:hypothetical protein